MNAITETDLAAILEQAATTFLPSVTTLETRNSDNADFHEVAAWCLKDALTAAFLAGQKAATQGQTTIAWENRPSEIIEFTRNGRHRTGRTFDTEWEARAWLAENNESGRYAYHTIK